MQYYVFAASALFAGIVAMAMAVRKAEAGANRFSLFFYVLSVALVVTAAKLASSGSTG